MTVKHKCEHWWVRRNPTVPAIKYCDNWEENGHSIALVRADAVCCLCKASLCDACLRRTERMWI